MESNPQHRGAARMFAFSAKSGSVCDRVGLVDVHCAACCDAPCLAQGVRTWKKIKSGFSVVIVAPPASVALTWPWNGMTQLPECSLADLGAKHILMTIQLEVPCAVRTVFIALLCYILQSPRYYTKGLASHWDQACITPLNRGTSWGMAYNQFSSSKATHQVQSPDVSQRNSWDVFSSWTKMIFATGCKCFSFYFKYITPTITFIVLSLLIMCIRV